MSIVSLRGITWQPRMERPWKGALCSGYEAEQALLPRLIGSSMQVDGGYMYAPRDP
jgi:hypothetical protein